jgi:Family of unknown function (DUF5677)
MENMSKAPANAASTKDLPPRKDVVQGFLDRHSLSKNANSIAIVLEPAIYWTDATLLLLQLGFASASQEALNDPTSGLLFNMLNRNFEVVEGAVVAFLSECGPTAELSSRAAIEFAASLMYILRGDRRLRLMAYFDDYITGVRLQVKRWRDTIVKLPVAHREDHTKAVAQREQANEALGGMVEQMRESFGVSAQREVWPSVAGRFEAIGASDHYRTVYARLSSQTHSDAEETLRYFVGVTSGSEELMNKMGVETIELTRMMLLFAVSDFVKASILFACVHDWSEYIAKLRAALLELDACLLEVSPKIGGLP